jgi:hypothetical protein
MFNAFKRYIPACLLMLSAAASAQTVSRVYITTSNGINGYNVAATGKLTAIAGSPFKETIGLVIGTAGSHFITVGTTYIRSYTVTKSTPRSVALGDATTRSSIIDKYSSPFVALDDVKRIYPLRQEGYSCIR